MDKLDRSIMRTLIADGRITSLDLANEVGLSATACARRVQLLEAKRYIAGYQAVIGLEELGYGATVIVSITLDRQTEDVLETFEQAIISCSSVLWCFLLAGTSDYIACVLAHDIKDYERIHKEQLSRLPGVASLQSTFALRRVVNRSTPADF